MSKSLLKRIVGLAVMGWSFVATAQIPGTITITFDALSSSVPVNGGILVVLAAALALAA